MKKVYTSIVALAIAVAGTAQNAPVAVQKQRANDNVVALEAPEVEHSVAATGDTINNLYYTFGTPANWIIDNASSNDAEWEFTTTGPYGSFSESYGVLASTSAADGWAMFDSDALGDNTTTHDTWIQMANPVDLTGFPSVAVTFQQLYAKFQGNSYVEVSTDGGTNWTQFEVNAAQAPNTASSDDGDIVSVNISSVAGGESQVWVRFRYVGGWDYAWQVDDLAFVEAPGNDLQISKLYHGDIINAWEYHNTPLSQATEIVLGVYTFNNGGAAQNNAVYTYDISDANGSVDSGTFPASNAAIAPFETDTTWYSTGFTPTATGDYTVTVSVAADETDEAPADNEASVEFAITDNIYSHDDEDAIELQIYGALDASDQANEYKTGMYYELIADATLTAVQVGFGQNTTTASCIVDVYDANDLESPLATEVYDIQPGDVSSGANINLVNILINEGDGIDLTAGGVYFISIGNTGVGEELFILAEDDGDDDNGTLQYGPFGQGGAVDWYTGYSYSPMVRANFDPTVDVAENEAVSGVSIYPNPAADDLTVNFVSKEDQDLTINVISSTGALVAAEQVTTKAGQSNRINFNVADLASGIYMVQIQGAASTLTNRVVVQ